jgi:hypothetical protein
MPAARTLGAADATGQITSNGDARRSAPLIVLTYAHAGGARLQSLLSAHPDLACTDGIGLLAACDQAAAAWRQADGRPQAPMSPLAAASVRALATAMISAVVARTGKRRWCETAAAERSAAETFLTLFPDTRFICLHRACPDVIFATLAASRWGLASPGYAAYTAAHPASTVAALAAWWADRARPVLNFEHAHPEACLRVRYEDLASDPAHTERGILKFIGLDGRVPWLPAPPDAADVGSRELSPADAPGCGADLPVAQIPPVSLAQVNALHARLGYLPLQEN